MIKSITIKNFRSIVEQTIEFDKFTCLVGNNDCGKSNILKALNLFFNKQTDFNTEFDFDRDYSKFAKKRNEKAEEITISIAFNLPSKKYKDNVITWKKIWRQNGFFGDNMNDIVSSRSKTRNLLENKIKYQYIPAIKSNEYFKDLMSKMYDSMMDSADKNLSNINKKYSDELQKITKNLTETLSNTLDINSVIEMPKNLSVLFKNLEFSTSDNFVKEINLARRGDGIRTRHIPSILKYIDDNMESSKVKRIFIWGYEEPENSIEFTSCSKMADELYEMSKDKQI
ncbi:ATP-binding protein [Campylobacter sp. VBCF_06 NA8]|uniref:ATP-dependent nuclease n=1 Tax=unclassified Campylobacter TaxID=2593542 RepID=UPI0022E9A845|nr:MULTISPECIES: AAA family ATPase [unclassified Campylobacter]MDA3046970.1 ATP-binding protein [Campylobacter sp. VBCF_06 NA8]MDA3048130.1 ATP-binding protein [Campylobacter sp. JMF_08 NE1]